ncbi:hypothetical protein T4A_2959 [Trichinella pseudospiralis]|uniref:Uncharacterized protein n=1 Tax=Trichinella pseudospiralis TaxID=6337 RepID=A0A0V1EAE8_TRIPS|nr:hypothetical protein T4A_2959 [Trichinella pseudospiralis]
MDVQVRWLLWLDGFCGMDFGVAVKLKWLILIKHFSIADAVRLNFAKLRNPNKHYCNNVMRRHTREYRTPPWPPACT